MRPRCRQCDALLPPEPMICRLVRLCPHHLREDSLFAADELRERAAALPPDAKEQLEAARRTVDLTEEIAKRRGDTAELEAERERHLVRVAKINDALNARDIVADLDRAAEDIYEAMKRDLGEPLPPGAREQATKAVDAAYMQSLTDDYFAKRDAEDEGGDS